jgi:large conductance mechanosensitive channel
MARSSLFSDFRKFLMQGNAVDLAVGVVIGTAFSKIVGALVDKLFMPIISVIISALVPGSGWKQWMIPLGGMMKVPDPDNVGKMIEVPQGIYIGEILAALIDFVAIGFVVFMLVRLLEQMKNRFKREQAVEAEAAPPDAAVLAQERLTNAVERLTQVTESRMGQ